MLKYIELKSGYSDNGPAWIGRVVQSRTGQTIYFNGRALKRVKGGGARGNFRDLETGEEFWVSGVKKNGEDRHWAGNGKVLVEAAAVAQYLAVIGAAALDPKRFEVTHNIAPTDVDKFRPIENYSPGRIEVDDDWWFVPSHSD